MHRRFWKDFCVHEAKYILRQHFIHIRTGDDMSAGNHLRVELETSELLLSDIVTLQEELAGFIIDHVANPDAEFSII